MSIRAHGQGLLQDYYHGSQYLHSKAAQFHFLFESVFLKGKVLEPRERLLSS